MTVVNTDQANAWNGQEGEHWARHADRYDAMSGAFTDPLFTTAAIAATDDVLDIGCGCGTTTLQAAQWATEGRTVGVDLSAPMLSRARATVRDFGVDNVVYEQADAQVAELGSEAFDVAISRFGIMFFVDPTAAFANIGAALRSGGRLAALCWRAAAENPWLMVPATAALAHVPFPDLGGSDEPGPFSLADSNRVDAVLAAAGFRDVIVSAVAAPMVLGRDAADAVGFLAGTGMARELLEGVDEATAGRALDAVAEALEPYETTGGVVLEGAAWLVTATH